MLLFEAVEQFKFSEFLEFLFFSVLKAVFFISTIPFQLTSDYQRHFMILCAKLFLIFNSDLKIHRITFANMQEFNFLESLSFSLIFNQHKFHAIGFLLERPTEVQQFPELKFTHFKSIHN
jgi:hypothetical protein